MIRLSYRCWSMSGGPNRNLFDGPIGLDAHTRVRSRASGWESSRSRVCKPRRYSAITIHGSKYMDALLMQISPYRAYYLVFAGSYS